MKIVEIIVLMGTQCISPIQHTPSMTEVSKVQCAVVIEKDSVTNSMEVSPPAAVNHPTVSEAMARLSKQSMPAIAPAPASQPFRIVPAAVARRGVEVQFLPKPLEPDRVPDAATEIAPPSPVGLPAAMPPAGAEVASLQAEPQEPGATEAAAEPEAKPKAEITAPKPKKAPTARKARSTTSKTATKLPGRCTGTARAQWHTNKDGEKKYRCVKSSAAAAKPQAAKASKGLY